MQGQNTYSLKTIIEFPGMVARIHIPVLTQEERARRMKAIHRTAAALLKKTNKKE